MNLYDVKLRKAIESIDRPTREHIKPLQPPDDHERPQGYLYFIDNEFEKLYESINAYDFNLYDSKQERNYIGEDLHIKLTLKEFPKVDVLVKEGLAHLGRAIRKNILWTNKRLISESYKVGNLMELDLEDTELQIGAVLVFLDSHLNAMKNNSCVGQFSAHLGEPLEKYFVDYQKVKVVRATSREGLVRARLRGYRVATGAVLVFLDSHIECTEGWIEPMLDRISRNWTTVVTPCIDIIDDDTFGFRFQGAKDIFAGGFDWKMVFIWHSLPENEQKRRNYEDHLPYRSPTMAGGLFAISRAYFTYIGTYDDGMDIWGGENLEISFRIWMCGGTLETTPCSHVGHIFRKRSPYKWRKNVDVVRKNNIRLCEVWLDEYKQYYYDKIGIQTLPEYGNITSRIELRKKLKCKSFEWFLKNVYPEMWVPGESLAYGQIAAKTQPYCLMGDCGYGQTGKPISLVNCSSGHNKVMYLTTAKEIKRDNGCVDYSGKPGIQMESCHQMRGNQEWEYREVSS
ncbi:GALNT [Mytilus coruscus]|uniref:Polypeptide N-acetylgalactosaminyltransferase n=1 Tax=Mytilus coruscus TaxID=42192 RepID=A0A6J8EMX9_MYTCO|nr:GALNT [Mytilus coruscus]